MTTFIDQEETMLLAAMERPWSSPDDLSAVDLHAPAAKWVISSWIPWSIPWDASLHTIWAI